MLTRLSRSVRNESHWRGSKYNLPGLLTSVSASLFSFKCLLITRKHFLSFNGSSNWGIAQHSQLKASRHLDFKWLSNCSRCTRNSFIVRWFGLGSNSPQPQPQFFGVHHTQSMMRCHLQRSGEWNGGSDGRLNLPFAVAQRYMISLSSEHRDSAEWSVWKVSWIHWSFWTNLSWSSSRLYVCSKRAGYMTQRSKT